MSSAHTLPIGGHRALAAGFRDVKDPLDGNTITFPAKDSVICRIVTIGADETRVLPAPGGHPIGAKLRVVLVDDGGDVSITHSTLDQTPILTDVNDTVEFVVTADESVDPVVNAWRVASDSRAGENATEAKTVDVPLNAGLGSGPWLADARTALTATAADPDCSLITGTAGTSNPLIRAGTVAHATNTLDYATETSFVVPDDYVAGGNLTLTLLITEDTAISNPDLETTAFNRDAPTTDLVIAPSGDLDLLGGGSFVVNLLGTNIAPGDTIDVGINFELTDDGVVVAQYDLTRATLGYTGNAG